MRAFITGSRRYGTPRPDSDVDLVVLLEGSAHDLLMQLGTTEPDNPYAQVRFGVLNIITLQDADEFERWRQVTEELERRAPVTREEAVAALKAAGL